MLGIYNYQWDPVTVKTDDGYTLTLIHITGNKGKTVESTKGPLLIQASIGTPLSVWLSYYFGSDPVADPAPLRLYKDGYDVYFSITRGMTMSDVKDGCAYEDACFWDWTYTDLAAYDLKAQMQYIYGQTGQKINLYGVATGNQMLSAAMGLNYDWLSQYTNKIAMVQPCIYPDTSLWDFAKGEFFDGLAALDVYEFGGPTWYLSAEKIAMSWGRVPLWGLMI